MSVKGFSPHKKRGPKKLGSPVEPPQGKGQWKETKFYTDEQNRVRPIPKYPTKSYSGWEITFRDDGKGNVLASIGDRKDVAKGATFQEAFRNAKKLIHQDYELEHSITKTRRKFKSQARPLKELQAEQDKKWEEIQRAEKEARERGVTDPEELFSVRLKIVEKYEKRLEKPDLKPIIYRLTIGHYGGYFIEVPEEHFEEFKSHFLPREFPMKVETIDVRKESLGAEERFRQRFPNSNKVKQVYFADRSVGTKRLEFLDLPRPE